VSNIFDIFWSFINDHEDLRCPWEWPTSNPCPARRLRSQGYYINFGREPWKCDGHPLFRDLAYGERSGQW
jgi:hypothetical protein